MPYYFSEWNLRALADYYVEIYEVPIKYAVLEKMSQVVKQLNLYGIKRVDLNLYRLET